MATLQQCSRCSCAARPQKSLSHLVLDVCTTQINGKLTRLNKSDLETWDVVAFMDCNTSVKLIFFRAGSVSQLFLSNHFDFHAWHQQEVIDCSQIHLIADFPPGCPVTGTLTVIAAGKDSGNGFYICVPAFHPRPPLCVTCVSALQQQKSLNCVQMACNLLKVALLRGGSAPLCVEK